MKFEDIVTSLSEPNTGAELLAAISKRADAADLNADDRAALCTGVMIGGSIMLDYYASKDMTTGVLEMKKLIDGWRDKGYVGEPVKRTRTPDLE